MAFWWVNQNKSSEYEIAGGYLWSPKRKKNGAKNYFYDTMAAVEVGDIIFSFYKTKIQHLGVATHAALSTRKPVEFGEAGKDWDNDGWLVKVAWHKIPTPFRPADMMETIAPLLPHKYAPLQTNGRGLQGVYLTGISDVLATALLAPMRNFAEDIISLAATQPQDPTIADQIRAEMEDRMTEVINSSTELKPTEKQALIMSRRGQGKFRERLEGIEHCCRFTGITNAHLLRASHIKPWRDSSNAERLDGNNGLLLTPDFDHLFDKGLISFEDNGTVLISTKVSHRDLEALCGYSLVGKNVGPFSARQAVFMLYHRESVFQR